MLLGWGWRGGAEFKRVGSRGGGAVGYSLVTFFVVPGYASLSCRT